MDKFMQPTLYIALNWSGWMLRKCIIENVLNMNVRQSNTQQMIPF